MLTVIKNHASNHLKPCIDLPQTMRRISPNHGAIFSSYLNSPSPPPHRLYSSIYWRFMYPPALFPQPFLAFVGATLAVARHIHPCGRPPSSTSTNIRVHCSVVVRAVCRGGSCTRPHCFHNHLSACRGDPRGRPHSSHNHSSICRGDPRGRPPCPFLVAARLQRPPTSVSIVPLLFVCSVGAGRVPARRVPQSQNLRAHGVGER